MKKISLLFVLTIFMMFPMSYSSIHAYGKSKEDVYIKINVWSNQLFVMKNNQIVATYPISTGKNNCPTPIGTFKIIEKGKSWGGGFGSRWLRLNVPWGQFGIHGTNKPMLIGKNVSSGCIRMRNQDVEALFEMVSKGTIVYIEGPITGKGQGAYKKLSIGSKGNLVQVVQERLKFFGLYYGRVDGIYGKSTEIAVKKFQKLNHLPITGGIGESEYRLLGLLE